MNINELPTEILVKIISNERSILRMLHLRAVCRLWDSLIELICQTQQSLILATIPLRNYENEYKLYKKHFRDRKPADATLYLGYFSESVDHKNLILPLEVAHFLTRQFPNLEGLVTLFSDQARYVRFGTESSFPGLKYLLNTWAPTLQTLSLYGSFREEDEDPSLTDEINKLTSIKRLAFQGCILQT